MYVTFSKELSSPQSLVELAIFLLTISRGFELFQSSILSLEFWPAFVVCRTKFSFSQRYDDWLAISKSLSPPKKNEKWLGKADLALYNWLIVVLRIKVERNSAIGQNFFSRTKMFYSYCTESPRSEQIDCVLQTAKLPSVIKFIASFNDTPLKLFRTLNFYGADLDPARTFKIGNFHNILPIDKDLKTLYQICFCTNHCLMKSKIANKPQWFIDLTFFHGTSGPIIYKLGTTAIILHVELNESLQTTHFVFVNKI